MKKTIHYLLTAGLLLCALLYCGNAYSQMPVDVKGATIDTAGFYQKFKGKDGSDGASSTVQVGNTTTLPAGSSATVTNSGTASNAVLNFGIPKGADGLNGTGSMVVPSFWTIRFVATFQEFKDAMLLSQSGSVRMIYIVAPFTWSEKIRCSDTPNNTSFSLGIEGNNNKIIIPANVDTALVRSYPSLSAANAKIDFQLDVKNLEVKGNNNVAFSITGTYQSSFDNSRFMTCKTALDIKFALQTSITNNKFWDCSYAAISLEYDKFQGGNNYSSQPNHSVIYNNCFCSKVFKCVQTVSNCFNFVFSTVLTLCQPFPLHRLSGLKSSTVMSVTGSTVSPSE